MALLFKQNLTARLSFFFSVITIFPKCLVIISSQKPENSPCFPPAAVLPPARPAFAIISPAALLEDHTCSLTFSRGIPAAASPGKTYYLLTNRCCKVSRNTLIVYQTCHFNCFRVGYHQRAVGLLGFLTYFRLCLIMCWLSGDRSNFWPNVLVLLNMKVRFYSVLVAQSAGTALRKCDRTERYHSFLCL